MHHIQGTGLRTGPTCMIADVLSKRVTYGTKTHVWADDGFGELRIVDRHTAYESMQPHGFVRRETPYRND